MKARATQQFTERELLRGMALELEALLEMPAVAAHEELRSSLVSAIDLAWESLPYATDQLIEVPMLQTERPPRWWQ